MPINGLDTPPDDALKLVSYNVCGYGGNYKYEHGFEKVLDYLIEEQADIVCLQEDIDTWRRYCFKQYEERGLQYNDTIVLCNDNTRFNCLGIHTKYPIIRRDRIDYSTISNNGSAAWWLKVGKDTVIVVNNHFESIGLTSKEKDEFSKIVKGEVKRNEAEEGSKKLIGRLNEVSKVRAPQADAVARFVDQHRDKSIILCGDFNDGPNSYTHHKLAKRLTDCYVASGNGLGFSYHHNSFYIRIDHIMCSKDWTPVKCIVDKKIDASDHYPVVCWPNFIFARH